MFRAFALITPGNGTILNTARFTPRTGYAGTAPNYRPKFIVDNHQIGVSNAPKIPATKTPMNMPSSRA